MNDNTGWLNHDLVLPTGPRATFQDNPVKKIFAPGTEFFRFVTLGDNYVLGGYWVDRETMSRVIALAKGDDERMKQIARSLSAVKEAWNREMHYIAHVSLLQPCWGWKGKARYQVSSEDNGLVYFGSGTQIFLPGLTKNHAAIVSFNQVGRITLLR